MTEPAAWRRLVAPSITRRVVLTLLATFGLGFAVLVAKDWWDIHRSDGSQRALPKVAAALAESLPAEPTREADARLIVQAQLQQLNLLRRQSGLALDDVQGRLARRGPADQAPTMLFESPQVPPAEVGDAPLPPDASRVWQGRTHWVAQARTPAWQLTLYEPLPPEATLLSWLGANLVEPFLIVLPLLALPMWWAVRRGLRPLRALVAAVQARSPDDPQPLGLTLRDAELRPLGEAFEALLARVRQSLQRERELVQDAAHELRTPLAVISAQAHVMHQARTPAERDQAHAALQRALQRGAHLVQQLLTLAALDEAPAGPSPTVDLVALLRQQVVGLSALADQRQMGLALDSPEQLWAATEPSTLASLVDNLVGNALRHANAGGQVELQLAALGTDGGWQLRVADDGPGIPADEQARLFERFRRGREARSSGSGLGLAIVRQAVRRLGGEVGFTNGLAGRGLGVVVTVPAAPAHTPRHIP